MKKFILGLFTGTVAIPIIEATLDIILSWIEIAKIAPSRKIVEWNKEMSDNEETPQEILPMGFVAPEEEFYDDDYEDE